MIEVSESSLDKDRKEIGPVYAAARIPYYWIVNIVDSVIEVYSQPESRGAESAYQKKESKGVTDQVPLMIECTEVGWVAVRAIFAANAVNPPPETPPPATPPTAPIPS